MGRAGGAGLEGALVEWRRWWWRGVQTRSSGSSGRGGARARFHGAGERTSAVVLLGAGAGPRETCVPGMAASSPEVARTRMRRHDQYGPPTQALPVGHAP